jgi:hypothetical protein
MQGAVKGSCLDGIIHIFSIKKKQALGPVFFSSGTFTTAKFFSMLQKPEDFRVEALRVKVPAVIIL